MGRSSLPPTTRREAPQVEEVRYLERAGMPPALLGFLSQEENNDNDKPDRDAQEPKADATQHGVSFPVLEATEHADKFRVAVTVISALLGCPEGSDRRYQ
jgi:hypothetical protein